VVTGQRRITSFVDTRWRTPLVVSISRELLKLKLKLKPNKAPDETSSLR